MQYCVDLLCTSTARAVLRCMYYVVLQLVQYCVDLLCSSTARAVLRCMYYVVLQLVQYCVALHAVCRRCNSGLIARSIRDLKNINNIIVYSLFI